ncbi:hypothetical protein E4T56_gene20407, partial [Termitomyces sp. T112]
MFVSGGQSLGTEFGGGGLVPGLEGAGHRAGPGPGRESQGVGGGLVEQPLHGVEVPQDAGGRVEFFLLMGNGRWGFVLCSDGFLALHVEGAGRIQRVFEGAEVWASVDFFDQGVELVPYVVVDAQGALRILREVLLQVVFVEVKESIHPDTLVPPTYSGVSQQPRGNPRSPMIPSTYQCGLILDHNRHPPTP